MDSLLTCQRVREVTWESAFNRSHPMLQPTPLLLHFPLLHSLALTRALLLNLFSLSCFSLSRSFLCLRLGLSLLGGRGPRELHGKLAERSGLLIFQVADGILLFLSSDSGDSSSLSFCFFRLPQQFAFNLLFVFSFSISSLSSFAFLLILSLPF